MNMQKRGIILLLLLTLYIAIVMISVCAALPSHITMVQVKSGYIQRVGTMADLNYPYKVLLDTSDSIMVQTQSGYPAVSTARHVGFSVACASPKIDCGGTCVDTDKDVNNCGSCSHSCGGNINAYCQDGECRCYGDLGYCGGTCVDSKFDNINCGKCGNICAGGRICRNGACVCPSPKIDCGGTCVDINSDDNNCGKCGKKCERSFGKICKNGACVCYPGTTPCYYGSKADDFTCMTPDVYRAHCD